MNAPISSSLQDPNCKKQPAAPFTHELVIGGITPFTSIDFPGRLAAVLYTQGCIWRCRYCHNSHLQPFQTDPVIPFSKALHFLRGRKGLLDGVVFCGGEPTAQAGLAKAMQEIKTMGFELALHTAGMVPDRFREVLPLCDWVGMDVKAPFQKYEKITQIEKSGELANQSLQLLLESGVDYEIRTTWHPALLSEGEILEMAKELSGLGVQNFVLQIFQTTGCSDKALTRSLVSEKTISEDLRRSLSLLFKSFQVRC